MKNYFLSISTHTYEEAHTIVNHKQKFTTVKKILVICKVGD